MDNTNKPPKVSAKFKKMQALYQECEALRLDISETLTAAVKSLPMSECEVCRRIKMSRSSYQTYKKNGLPFDKIGGLIEFLSGLTVDNQKIIL